jgi:hypothetical protein
MNFRLDGDLGALSAPRGEEGEEGAIESAASLCLRLRGLGGMIVLCAAVGRLYNLDNDGAARLRGLTEQKGSALKFSHVVKCSANFNACTRVP